eukprot:5489301-Alexandrium_andersonii.AAC.1
MSASLVGSEMCIRDRDPEARVPPVQQRGSVHRWPEVARACRVAGQGRVRGEPQLSLIHI